MRHKALNGGIDAMAERVGRMLDPHMRLPKAKTPHEAEALQRQVGLTDKQIDELVYELYGLNKDRQDACR